MPGSRSTAVWGGILFLIVLATGALTAFAADAWPHCGFNCTAGDVSLASVYAVVSGGTCEPGGTSTARIYGQFTASAKRYAVILIGDLHVEGGVTRHLEECAGDLSAGTTDALLATVTWPCGSTITLEDVIVSWSTNSESCSDAKCASRVAQCSSGHSVTASTPIVVDFSSNEPQCLGTPIAFENRSTGGAAPYTTSWSFGDGETSSQASPSHTYAAPGSYTVTLTVRDRTGASDSHSRSIVVSPLPAATAGNAGPYCPGETISLVSSGGTSYSWTGPNGFSSVLQNPSVPSASEARAGTYTVTATNASGCTARASTEVVVDSTPPVLSVPASVTVECSRPTGPAATGQAIATDDSGRSPTVSYSDTTNLTACGGTGTIARTWVATDVCGNSMAVTQTITIVDTTSPMLVVPDDGTIECGHSVLPGVTGQATATDACAAPTVAYSDHESLTGCGGTRTIARTWTAIDACGNEAAGVQTITILDTQPPSLSVPADVAVECGHSTAPAAAGHATASDGCSIPSVTYADRSDLSGCSGSGTIMRTWTAIDACGHTATGTQAITVTDTRSPHLAVPADITVECGYSTLPDTTGHAAATDSCSIPVVTYEDDSHLTGCGGTGTILRTWTATDSCGRTTAGTQTISIVDTRTPSLTVPSDVTVEAGSSILPAAAGQAMAIDTCSAVAMTYVDASDLASDGTGTVLRSWTATDSCGHAATGTQTITVVSAPPATLTLTTPMNVTVEVGRSINPSATGAASAVSTCATPPSLTYSDAADLAGCDGTGTILRTWVASDDCGNTASDVQTIVVVDTGELLLTVPADATIEAETPSDPSVTGWATADDPSSPDEPPSIAYSDAVALSGCDETGSILRTWTATDECGNRVSAVQTITVIDSGHASLSVPADVTVETGDPTDPAATGWATASDPDAVDEPPSVTYSDVTDLTGCGGTGVILRTWSATDGCGNAVSAAQLITVVDTRGPSLTAPADVAIETVDSPNPSVTGWASVGYHDPSHPPLLTYSDVADLTGCDGTGVIVRTWEASDACGNVAIAVQIITVKDSGHVSLLVPPDAVVPCGHSTSPDVTGWATASDPDAVNEAPEVEYSDVRSSECGGAGTVLRTWTGADECGNEVSAVQTITLADNTPPSLDLPADVMVEYGSSTEPAVTGRASAADSCSVTSLSHTDAEVSGWCVGRTTLLRTWTASDECGNSTSAVQTITVVDTTPPGLTLPADATIECGHATSPEATGHAVASDASGTAILAFADQERRGGCVGSKSILRTWTAADACGNAVSAVQTITVADFTPPSLTVPSDMTVEVGHSLLPADLGLASGTDGCSEPMVTYIDSSSLGTDGTGTITRTWTATDACGNATQGIQTITVVGAPPPPQLTLMVPKDLTVDTGQRTDPSATGTAVSASNCAGGAALSYADRATLEGCDGTGTIERTWTAVDGCGNEKSAVQTITVVDLGRVELVVPADVSVTCGESVSPVFTGIAVADDPDATDEPPVVTYADAATLDSCSGAGTIRRTWTATDACGNSLSAVQAITVTGSCAPRVIISEIAWAGTGASAEDQWIELRNLGDSPVDLRGWTLRWRAAKPEVPDDAVWKRVPLSGVIDPAARDTALPFGPNPQNPQTWWVDLSGRRARGDFYLLERATDETVLDVKAGLVYDNLPENARTLPLSDRGDVLELVSPGGCVIDTANSAQSEIGGWAAGDAATRGSMERTDPYGGDSAENWHTNLGIITSGEDAGGDGLLATAGLENEPKLAELVAEAALAALPVGAGASVAIPLPGEIAPESDLGRVVALSSGSGIPVMLPIDASSSSGTIVLTASSALPTGQNAVWVRMGDAAILVLLSNP